MTAIFAVDLGATWLRSAMISSDGRINHKRRVFTPQAGTEAAQLIEAAWRQAGAPPSVALATAPELDAHGIVRRWPNCRGYEGANLVSDAVRRTAELALFDDATAAALSTHDFDDAGDARATVCLSIGSGIGGGAVIANAPLIGAHRAAMDVGHMPVPSAAGLRCACGRDGCLQAVSSGLALRQRAGEGDLFNADAQPVVDRAVEALAEALAILDAIFDPGRVVFAGGLGLSPLFDLVATRLQARGARLTIERHRCGEDAALVGAAVGLARSHALRGLGPAIDFSTTKGHSPCPITSPTEFPSGRASTRATSNV